MQILSLLNFSLHFHSFAQPPAWHHSSQSTLVLIPWQTPDYWDLCCKCPFSCNSLLLTLWNSFSTEKLSPGSPNAYSNLTLGAGFIFNIMLRLRGKTSSSLKQVIIHFYITSRLKRFLLSICSQELENHSTMEGNSDLQKLQLLTALLMDK